MKVLNLRCEHDHRFEGWFGGDDDFRSQVERRLVECPLCGAKDITRLPTAPRLNVSGRRETALATTADAADPKATGQARWIHAVREMLEQTEDVGERFPEEARRIHYGETAERGIRGRATREEAEALREEGIEVVSIPVPAAMTGSLQ